MKTLHDVAVYWSPSERKWVIKHTTIKTPFSSITKVTVQRLFLTKTGLRAVKAQLDLIIP